MALIEARRAGADEVLFLDTAGHCPEASASNLFAVIGGTLATPPTSCAALPGITRGAVIEMAAELGVTVDERPFGLDDAGRGRGHSDQLLRGIALFVRVSGHPIGTGTPGAITRRVVAAYAALVTREARVIIETIVTTIAQDGEVNCAPMGVEWNPDAEPESIVLKPSWRPATYRNVLATRAAVVNLIDDVRVFAKAAISNPAYQTVPAQAVRGVVLADACSWRELEVTAIDSTPPRSRIDTRTVHRQIRREFVGFNRARRAG